MRVLLVSTLKRRLGPDVTASRSRIIFELAQGLLQKGHEVSILGTGDSNVPGARIIPIIPKAFVDLPSTENPFYAETGYLVQLAKAVELHASDYDVVHNHTYPEFINLLISRQLQTPMLTTIHAQATAEFDQTLSLFSPTGFVSISKAHQRMFPKTKIPYVVYNGIDTNVYAYQEKKDDYLLWLGRLGKAKDEKGNFIDAKGVAWAIKLAQETGERLIISGNVEDMAFYDKEVKPHLTDRIVWYGPMEQEQVLKREEIVKLMQEAKAFLMTINWEEPFGLVMAEAGSCGTPVIAFDRGAVPEIVIDGKTGFVVPPHSGVEGLASALVRLKEVRSEACRDHIVSHFSIDNMVSNYEKLYQNIRRGNQ